MIPLGPVAQLLAELHARTLAHLDALAADLDLSVPQLEALLVLEEHPGLYQHGLAMRMGTDPSRVVHLVDDLERMMLVERRRNWADRRVHELHLVADARIQFVALRAALGRIEAQLTAGLDWTERDTLARLLAKLEAGPGSASDAA